MIILNFRKQSVRDMIISGTKTIETRALNPEEPEKYFGNVQVGDIILLCNKLTGEEIQATVTERRIWNNFDALWQEQELLYKIASDKETLSQMKSGRDLQNRRDRLAPWYGDKCEENGIIWLQITLIDQIGYIDDTILWLPYQDFDSKMYYAGKWLVIDKEGNIAIIHSTTHGWYELPWGHIDPGENSEESFIRECKEEIGCDVEVVDYIGYIIEQRHREQYKKTSYYFIAKLIGEKGEQQLEEQEQADWLETLWISPNELKQLFIPQEYEDIERRFVQARDSIVVEKFLTYPQTI